MNLKIHMKTVWQFAKNYKLFFVLAEICILISYAVSLILPLNLTKLIDNVFMKSKYEELGSILLIYTVLFIVAVVFNMLYAYVFQTLNNRFVVDVKNKLFHKIIYADTEFLSSMNSGDIMNRIDNDASQFIFIVQRNVFHFVNSIIMCIGIIIMVAQKNLIIAIMTVFAAILPIIVSRVFGKMKEKVFSEKRELEGVYEGKLFEVLKGMREIKLMCAKKWAESQVLLPLRKLVKAENKLRKTNFMAEKLVNATNLFATILIYIYSIRLISNFSITAGVFLAIIEYVALLHRKMDWIVSIYLDWSERKTAINRINEILSLKSEEGGNNLNEKIEQLKFKNVFFKYGEKEVLENISFEINKGEKVGFVGFSGVGKTTITNLITKLLKPVRGKILINNKDVSEIRGESLRKRIGIVKQEVLLFDGTVRYNLTLGNSFDDNELLKALQKSGWENISCDDLEKQGSTLSGGQKQRVMLARLFLQDADLFILDEGTSALDERTESVMIKSLNELIKIDDKAMLIVSHRLSTVKNCDRIIVLRDNQIESVGTHSELLEKSLTYRKMFEEVKCA